MSDYPKAYRHPVTKQERTATSKAQEVALKFDGYRPVETEAPAPEEPKTDDGASGEAPKAETPPPAPKAAAPKPGPTPKAQEGK